MPNNGIRFAKLRRLGNASGITIPAEFLVKLNCTIGNNMRIDLVDDYLVVRRNDDTPIKLKLAPRKLGPGRSFAGR